MKLPAPLAEAFNRQVTLELASSIAYVQLSAYFESIDLPGMAGWMRTQASEERHHADKLMGHLIDRRAEVRIGEIPGPEHDIVSPLAAFEAALAHEHRVSEAIRDLYRLATEMGDIDALPLLQWFVAEQIEEEASVEEIIAQISRLGEDGSALLILDRELGQRQPSVR